MSYFQFLKGEGTFLLLITKCHCSRVSDYLSNVTFEDEFVNLQSIVFEALEGGGAPAPWSLGYLHTFTLRDV